MDWVRLTAGRLKSDFRYSSALSYNSFPFINMSEDSHNQLSNLAVELLTARERFPDLSLAEIYDPLKMPECVRKAHSEIDYFYESLLGLQSSCTETERLNKLIHCYVEMTGGQNA